VGCRRRCACIGGSHGIVPTNGFTQFSRSYPDYTDDCGNARREFVAGLYYKFTTGGTPYFWICEIRQGVSTIVSMYREYNNLVVLIGVSADEAYRVNNVFATSATRRIEMRGSISTGTEDGFSNGDGWLEVRINNRPYRNGDDYALIDPNSEPDICDARTGSIIWPYAEFGWNTITFGFGGDATASLDCLYYSSHAQWCNERETQHTPGRCPPPGPGGSSSDGSPTGPRTVQSGGYPATYVQPTGGGVPATASNPTDPQSLTGVQSPLISLDITLPSGITRSLSHAPISHGAGPSTSKGIVDIGDVVYPFSDRFGNLRAQTWEVTIADPDGEWRQRQILQEMGGDPLRRIRRS
jgi:hypothetical protein